MHVNQKFINTPRRPRIKQDVPSSRTPMSHSKFLIAAKWKQLGKSSGFRFYVGTLCLGSTQQPINDRCLLYFCILLPFSPQEKEKRRDYYDSAIEKEEKCTFIGEEICLFGAFLASP
ncbi:hypothetical protein CDAR_531771 [Caerostris darwini]|uniref:Uncharacterized protein n=1 Tax=Caerostris darwini TaxID=1538125 RepID=A0AAV4SK86_9ARAC|nr:hypothetical protein CDAR_531771 [Caerostris darwini]